MQSKSDIVCMPCSPGRMLTVSWRVNLWHHVAPQDSKATFEDCTKHSYTMFHSSTSRIVSTVSSKQCSHNKAYRGSKKRGGCKDNFAKKRCEPYNEMPGHVTGPRRPHKDDCTRVIACLWRFRYNLPGLHMSTVSRQFKTCIEQLWPSFFFAVVLSSNHVQHEDSPGSSRGPCMIHTAKRQSRAFFNEIAIFSCGEAFLKLVPFCQTQGNSGDLSGTMVLSVFVFFLRSGWV